MTEDPDLNIEPRKWTDSTGRTRWQPRYGATCLTYNGDFEEWSVGSVHLGYRPYLCRTKKGALRISKRKHRRIARQFKLSQ